MGSSKKVVEQPFFIQLVNDSRKLEFLKNLIQQKSHQEHCVHARKMPEHCYFDIYNSFSVLPKCLFRSYESSTHKSRLFIVTEGHRSTADMFVLFIYIYTLKL